MAGEWTGPYRRVVAAGKLPWQAAILDGEIIVQDENGISDFDALRSAIHKAPHRLVFFAFAGKTNHLRPAVGGPLVRHTGARRVLFCA